MIASCFLFAEGDLGKEIKSKYDNGEDVMVTVQAAMGEEKAIGNKQMAK